MSRKEFLKQIQYKRKPWDFKVIEKYISNATAADLDELLYTFDHMNMNGFTHKYQHSVLGLMASEYVSNRTTVAHQVKLVIMCLEKGADPNIDKHTTYPLAPLNILHIVSRPEVAEVLLKYGVKITDPKEIICRSVLFDNYKLANIYLQEVLNNNSKELK